MMGVTSSRVGAPSLVAICRFPQPLRKLIRERGEKGELCTPGGYDGRGKGGGSVGSTSLWAVDDYNSDSATTLGQGSGERSKGG